MKELAPGASELERDLIAALSKRFANPQPEDRSGLDRAYADAMRELWHKYPADDDVGALFAESMMDLRPWDLWKADGTPQPGTPEPINVSRDAPIAGYNSPMAPAARGLVVSSRWPANTFPPFASV